MNLFREKTVLSYRNIFYFTITQIGIILKFAKHMTQTNLNLAYRNLCYLCEDNV